MAVESKSCALSRSSSHLWWFRTADSAFCEGGVGMLSFYYPLLSSSSGLNNREAGRRREAGGRAAGR
jgi:hypothetical protein